MMAGNEVTLNYQDQAACLRDSGFVQQGCSTRTFSSVVYFAWSLRSILRKTNNAWNRRL